jgi:type II secretory pathway component PulJ
MNLIEVMLATVLFSCSAGSCLQLWGLVSLDAQRQQQRQQLAERLEAELVSLEAHLHQQPRQAQALPPCGPGPEPLRSLLAAQPVAAGVQRQISALGLEEGLLVELSIEGSSLRRQRLYRAAALGLCLPAGPAAAGAAAPQTAPAPVAQPLRVGGSDGLS